MAIFTVVTAFTVILIIDLVLDPLNVEHSNDVDVS